LIEGLGTVVIWLEMAEIDERHQRADLVSMAATRWRRRLTRTEQSTKLETRLDRDEDLSFGGDGRGQRRGLGDVTGHGKAVQCLCDL
jgi:hypothetical protein